MLRGTLADCSPHVVLADRSLATRVGGAGVKVTVGVRVSGVIRTTLADGVTVKARYYNQLLIRTLMEGQTFRQPCNPR